MGVGSVSLPINVSKVNVLVGKSIVTSQEKRVLGLCDLLSKFFPPYASPYEFLVEETMLFVWFRLFIKSKYFNFVEIKHQLYCF